VPYPPIADYALLSDCHSAVLVSREGSVDWAAFHRFDARPVFSRILDWNQGGHFQLAPATIARCERRYLPDTMMLETRLSAEGGGVLELTDFLSVREAGLDTHPYHQLVRRVRCEGAGVEMLLSFVPRFDFGLTVPRLEQVSDGLWIVYGGADALVLQCPFDVVDQERCDCRATTTLRDGDEMWISLSYVLPHRLDPRVEPDDVLRERFDTTRHFWESWAQRCSYVGPYRTEVARSALVLKALTNAPTGAIVAAPTTSLPERIGGSRNWDYRYTWLRDAAFELYALFRLGYTDEAESFMRWLRRTTAGRAEDLQILYGVAGERLLPEVELDQLEGYAGSRPVRFGNAASEQFQLDVYGHLLDAAWQYHRHGGAIDDGFFAFLREVIDSVADRWDQPDAGIWEVRSEPEHFVLSKVMAWVAADRGVRLARDLGYETERLAWTALRTKIRADVDARGTASNGAFKRSYTDESADAANLLIPLVHFVRADDPRVAATVELVQRELVADGLVARYRGDDGVGGGEGAFVIASFWLVDNLAVLGRVDEARALFDQLVARANDLGLLAEEIDPHTGAQLGNFPQAFSHVGLIGAALNLEKAGAAQPGH
jgi:GH15 family glucan-1,4-alpha-glucosidase